MKPLSVLFSFSTPLSVLGGKIYAIGGRVLNFVTLSEEFKDAQIKIFKNIELLNWESGFFRKDIGYKVIKE